MAWSSCTTTTPSNLGFGEFRFLGGSGLRGLEVSGLGFSVQGLGV